MNENTKTAAFVVVALAVLSIAWFARPRSARLDAAPDVINQALFPEFTEPLAATSLEVVKFDNGKPKQFKVAQVKGRWSIPSHSEYPADAKEQLAAAATSLTNLTVLDLASDSVGEHEQYGVVDPTAKDLKAGASGVGTRVIMRDKDDKPLIDLIVGKELPDRGELRYVRRPNQDAVLVVKASIDKLSTNFGDWIEKDLLKMNTADVKQVNVRDYSIDIVQGVRYDKGEMLVEYQEPGDPRWKLVRDLILDEKSGKMNPQSMAADEEVNATKLDDLKWALADLKIIDVQRKPELVAEALKKSASLRIDRETIKNVGVEAINALAQSLGPRGFYFVPVENGAARELMSTEGEVRVGQKDGVVYVLRFGGLATESTDDSKKDDPAASASTDRNRYLFVVAEFDKSLIEAPKLEPLPEEKPEAKKEEAKPDAKDGEKKEDPAKDVKAERERIEKENKRKQDEYDQKAKKGEEHVKELNARFADWYYVINDSVYQKIHLSRADVVKKKEAEKKEGEASVPGLPGMPADSPGALDALKGLLPSPKEDAAADEKKTEEAPEAKKEAAPAPKAEEPKKTEEPKDEAAMDKPEPAAEPKKESPATEKPAEPKQEAPAADKAKEEPAKK